MGKRTQEKCGTIKNKKASLSLGNGQLNYGSFIKEIKAH